MKKQLKRSSRDRWLGGVCGGIAEYYGLDSDIVRFCFCLLGIALDNGVGIALYLIALMLIPGED
jgi:phage shock protein C